MLFHLYDHAEGCLPAKNYYFVGLQDPEKYLRNREKTPQNRDKIHAKKYVIW